MGAEILLRSESEVAVPSSHAVSPTALKDEIAAAKEMEGVSYEEDSNPFTERRPETNT